MISFWPEDWLMNMMPILLFFSMWIALVLFAFLKLRKQRLEDTAKVMWGLIILVPIIGAISYLVINSRKPLNDV